MLRIEINGTVFQLELEENPTAKELQKILPNTFSMEDLNQNEKFFDLPEHLPKNERAVGEIEAGDVMLYGDSTLVLFYRSFETSYSYTRIGKLLNAEKFAKVAGNKTIVVEIQKEDLP